MASSPGFLDLFKDLCSYRSCSFLNLRRSKDSDSMSSRSWLSFKALIFSSSSRHISRYNCSAIWLDNWRPCQKLQAFIIRQAAHMGTAISDPVSIHKVLYCCQKIRQARERKDSMRTGTNWDGGGPIHKM